jgi:hypothetical protein
MHEALAHLSSRGVRRIIKGSRHTFSWTPLAVIDAVDEVLCQLHAEAKILRRRPVENVPQEGTFVSGGNGSVAVTDACE